MRKRYLLFMFIFLFICVGKVSAYKCSYDTENGLWSLKVNYDVDNNGISLSGAHTILDFYVADNLKNETNDKKISGLVKFLDGKCQKSIYMCKGTMYHRSGREDTYSEGYAILLDMQYQIDAVNFNESAKKYTNSFDDDNVQFSGNNNCWSIDINESESTGKIVDVIGDQCFSYNSYIKQLKSNFPKCEKNDVQSCYTFNTVKSKLKTLCSSTVSYGSYNNPCVVSCLGLEQELANIENSEINEGTCNVSDKILKLIKNVFKWGKYIAPVLVIILSILDFIKALAAQNDDEMKKAQGRFVKRLISAALLFIIPFLIEFALDTFHLVSDNPYCDII